MEAEAQRRLTQMVKDSAPQERVKLLSTTYADGKPGCNPHTSVCVSWERNDAADIQSKGKGIAYRITEGEHYAEVKTQGYVSNTFVSITHDDQYASTVIGDGSPGGNVVNIKQNNGVLRIAR